MRFSPRELVRYARPLAAVLVVALQAACSDAPGITAPEDVAPSAEVAPASDLAAALAPALATTGSAGTVRAVANLRVGPGTAFKKVGSAAAGTAVTVVCSAVGRAMDGSAAEGYKLSTGTWISSGYVSLNAGSPTPPVCGSPAGPQIASGLRGNNYPYKNDAWQPGCPHDAWNFCLRQCTSFVSWRLRNVNGIEFYGGLGTKSWGAAYNWSSVARALGYPVDRKPAVGAVAQWTSSSSGNGHVAWVSAVSSDSAQVTIEEYNYGTRGGYGTRTVSTSSVTNFIHLY